MMLTGTIGQREKLHAKMAAHPHVLSARVMRAESVNRVITSYSIHYTKLYDPAVTSHQR